MVSPGFPWPILPSIKGLTLLALLATTGTLPAVALLPTVRDRLPALPAASLAQQPPGIYTLGGGDNIRIDIFDLPQLSGDYQIPAGGAIQLPLIGSISVQGLTLEQAADAISSAYAPILKRPLITVSLRATRPLNVWISGEVNRPGSYAIPLTSGAGTTPSVQFPTLVQALERAQGVTLAADIRRIELRRRTGSGPEEVYAFDLQKFLRTGDISEDITLRDGDTIFVPTATNLNLAQARQFAGASFATSSEQPRNVTVLGEVSLPGSYVIIGGNTATEVRAAGLPTVTRAIQLAGGIKPQADIRQIQVRRLTKTGAEQIFILDLWQLLQAGDSDQDTIVQNGDTIYVPTASQLNPAEVAELAESSFSTQAIQVSVIGEVRSPGGLKVSSNTTLNQALLTAGGFTPGRARRDSVELIRLNVDGTVSRRTVKVDLDRGIDEQTNPLLRNNDIILVRPTGLAGLTDKINTAISPASGVLAAVSIPSRVIETLKILGIFK